MTNEQKVGLFTLVGVLLAFAAVELTVGTGLMRRGYDLWVEFSDVHGLTVGDKVRVAGLRLGKVESIELAEDRVRVRLRLDHEAVVRADSVATLDYEALSGSRFVSLSLGSPRERLLRPGETVRGEVLPGLTQTAGELNRLAQAVTELAESFNENQERLLTNVNALLEENRSSLTTTLRNIESLTSKLDRGNGTLAKLVDDPELYDRLVAVTGDLQAVSAQLAAGKGTIGRLLFDEGLYDDARETMVDLGETVRNFQELSSAVRRGEGTLGLLVTDDALYHEARDAVRGLDRATTSIEDQSPVLLLGTFVSTLF